MIPAHEVIRSLYGAARLALFKPDGFTQFDGSLKAFWHSFFAAALVAPLYGLLMLVRAGADTEVELTIVSALAGWLAYAVHWLAFPVAMLSLTEALNKQDRYLTAMTAYNWAAVWQNVVFLPLAILGALGTIHADGASFLGLIVLGWSLLYSGFILAKALDVPPTTAAGLIAVDMIIGLTVNALATNTA